MRRPKRQKLKKGERPILGVAPCDACGETIDLNSDDWTMLGNKMTIHYGGEHQLTCWLTAQG